MSKTCDGLWSAKLGASAPLQMEAVRYKGSKGPKKRLVWAVKVPSLIACLV